MKATSLTALVAVAILAAAVPTASAATYYVAPGGSNSASGTLAAPWQTLGKALATAAAGDIVYLRQGTYGVSGTRTIITRGGTPAAPITFAGYPGEARPVVVGYYRIMAPNLRFHRLAFTGPTGRVKPPSDLNPKGEEVKLWINAANVEISSSVVRDSLWHAGIYLSDAEGARIVGNCIGNNGDRDPAVYAHHANHSHGIYWSSGSGVIADNLIDYNVARGIQLYKHPHDVKILHNTVVGNGRAGIQIANDTTRSLAANNIVAYNGDVGIRDSSLTSLGVGNAAVNNLGFGNGKADFRTTGPGLVLSANVSSNPLFANAAAADFHLAAASPGVDRAVAAYSLPQDLDSVARPLGGAPDLGAYESGSTAVSRRPVC